MKKFAYILCSLHATFFILLTACAPSRPSGVLSHDEMEAVLYDMHVAQAMYDHREGISSDADLIALRASVLKKHDITQEEWDSSYNYYCRNTREMYEIYQSLSEHIGRNLVALGGKMDGVHEDAADTANVWRDASSFILMQQPPYNRHTFEITLDSTFEDGDRLTLQCDVQFVFQDGYRNITSLLAVYYDNDSVATSVNHTSQDGHGVVTIDNDKERLHVKKIRGYMMLGQEMAQSSSSQNTTPLRLAAIRNVKLLHLRTQPPTPTEGQPTGDAPIDSLKRDSLFKDSIMKSHPTVINP